MSFDDEPDIRDVLMKALEDNGTLAKIRAQLRAAVFLALEDQTAVKNKMPLLNAKARSYCQSQEGKLCCALLFDFLKSLELDASYTVAAKEMQYDCQPDVNAASAELGVHRVNDNEPLLTAVIRRCMQSSDATDKTSKVEKTHLNGHAGAWSGGNADSKRTSSDVKLHQSPASAAAAVEDLFDEVLSPAVKKPPPTAWTTSSNFIKPLDSQNKTGNDLLSKKSPGSAGSRSIFSELPDLMTKRTLPPLETSLNAGFNNKSISKLLENTLDSNKSSSGSSSANTTPASSARNDKGHDTKQTNHATGLFSATKKPIDDGGGSSVSEEIVEDLEVAQAGDSARSDAVLSF